MKLYSLQTTHYLLIAITSSLLVGCAASTVVEQAKKTASGVVNPIVDTAKEAQKRAEQIKNGVESIQDGIENIKKAAN